MVYLENELTAHQVHSGLRPETEGTLSAVFIRDCPRHRIYANSISTSGGSGIRAQ